jgi:hypothetical protein
LKPYIGATMKNESEPTMPRSATWVGMDLIRRDPVANTGITYVVSSLLAYFQFGKISKTE